MVFGIHSNPPSTSGPITLELKYGEVYYFNHPPHLSLTLPPYLLLYCDLPRTTVSDQGNIDLLASLPCNYASPHSWLHLSVTRPHFYSLSHEHFREIHFRVESVDGRTPKHFNLSDHTHLILEFRKKARSQR